MYESPTENSKNQSGAKLVCAKFQSGLTRRALLILNACKMTKVQHIKPDKAVDY